MQITSSIPNSKRRIIPKRPRLGNTWQDFGWRKKLVSAVSRDPLAGSTLPGRRAHRAAALHHALHQTGAAR